MERYRFRARCSLGLVRGDAQHQRALGIAHCIDRAVQPRPSAGVLWVGQSRPDDAPSEARRRRSNPYVCRHAAAWTRVEAQ